MSVYNAPWLPFGRARRDSRVVAAAAWNDQPLDLPALTVPQRANLRQMPKDVIVGLRMLRDGPHPPVTCPERWLEIAEDTINFAANGWAGKALSDGWSTLEIFGCAAAREGDEYLLGITARLAGRHVFSVSRVGVTVSCNSGGIVLARPKEIDAPRVHLWEFGR